MIEELLESLPVRNWLTGHETGGSVAVCSCTQRGEISLAPSKC